MIELTTRAIAAIMEDHKPDCPILQVLGIKKISGSGTNVSDRYRVLLSDGVYTQSSAMLATQLNGLVSDGSLETHCVIKLDKYVCNPIQDRKVMILLSVTVMAKANEVGKKLGDPSPYKAGAATQQPQQQQPQQQQQQQQQTPPPSVNASAAQNNTSKPIMNNNKTQGAFYGGNKAGTVNIQNVPSTPGGTPTRIHSIKSLTPYQNRWTIRARVGFKSNVRTWSNSRGEGKLFNMNLIDESGEIRCTLFKEQVDKYYDLVQVNKVYYISKCTLKPADKRYSSVNNDYEMTFNNDSQLWLCEEEADIPTVKFNFVAINKLEEHEANAIVDVIGVVKHAEELATVVGKTSQREIKKRDLHLVDSGQVQIRLTLWGSDAENFKGESCPVLAVKGAKLSDWNGRSLSALGSSQIVLNPDVPEAGALRSWYDTDGQSVDYAEYRSERSGASGGHTTTWRTLRDVIESPMDGDAAVYFSNKCTIVAFRKESPLYQACPTDNCNKKVVDLSNGMYRCEKCSKEFPNFKWRMILSCNVLDHTDHQWVTFFQEAAEKILGRNAQQLGDMQDKNADEYDQVFVEANFKSYNFKFRTKSETYNGETRLKTVGLEANPIDFKQYSQKLITDIEALLQSK